MSAFWDKQMRRKRQNMKRIRKIQNFLLQSNQYFDDNQADITEHNHRLLLKLTKLTLLLLAGYFVFMWFALHNMTVQIIYLIYFFCMVAFTFFAYSVKKVTPKDFRLYQSLCTIYDVSLLLFIIALSIFPTPKDYGIFFPSFLLFVPCIFVLKLSWCYTIILSMEGIYLLLVVLFKEGTFPTDAITSITALVLAFVLNYIISDLRIHDSRITEKYIKMSRIDQLTNVLNKATIENICRQHVEEYGLMRQFAIMIIDVDNFKNINDSYGHQHGDQILKSISASIKHVFKEDTVGRIGGDEFMVLIKRPLSRGQLTSQAESFLNEVETPCTIGISVNDQTIHSYQELFQQADKALYHAKQNGKNTYGFYDESQ